MKTDHAAVAATYPPGLLEAVIADLGARNLRDYQDHATRWQAERLTACRRERKNRRQK